MTNVPGCNSSTAGTDTLGFTGSRNAADNYRVWLDNPDGINYGRLLTFGDGMRHMGYWNQGLVKAYGSFANRNPGMQNIVMPTLVNGFPCLSDVVNDASYPSWLQTGDYDAHTQLYADARRDNGALIFASNTSHTLKMFYLERSNYDSSLAMRFNLQPELFQQIKKVDQDGAPVSGAAFDLYAVDATSASDAAHVTLDEVTEGPLLTSLVTGSGGTARFMDGSEPFNFADRVTDEVSSQLYLLKETSAPSGYRMMPVPLLLRYDRETGTFIVNNRYDTGSYASFNSYVNQISNESLTFGAYDVDTGYIAAIDVHVPLDQQGGGLVVAIPTIKQSAATRAQWDPLYGSNNQKLETLTYDPADENAMRNAMLQAVLHQAYLSSEDDAVPGWYLTWNATEKRLRSYQTEQGPDGEQIVCTLSDLLGTPSRYILNNPDGDMQMVYLSISPEAISAAGVGAIDDSARRYEALGAACADDVSAALDRMMAVPGGMRIIDASDLDRNFQALVYIPNGVRQLRLWKVGQEGERIDGAVFALFDTAADAERACEAVVEDGIVRCIQDANGERVSSFASGVTGVSGADDPVGSQHGSLVFAPDVDDGAGSAHTMWIDADGRDLLGSILYLKEVQVPNHYLANETIIPVIIGRYGVYADAGSAGDGVEVLAGAGALAAPLRKIASSPEVNLTLRYLLSSVQAQESLALDGSDARIVGDSVDFSVFDQAWQPSFLEGEDAAQKQMHLVYRQTNALVDYGAEPPFTESELKEGVGYIDA